jgi:hypothetical protein
MFFSYFFSIRSLVPSLPTERERAGERARESKRKRERPGVDGVAGEVAHQVAVPAKGATHVVVQLAVHWVRV